MAMEIDEVIDEIKSIVTVNTEKQAEALNWAVNYMTLLKSALNDYKDRKVEKVAMLEELKTEIEGIEIDCPNGFEPVSKTSAFYDGVSASSKVIQQKINKLRGNENGNDD